MSTFEVGEIAIIKSSAFPTLYPVGMEVTIIAVVDYAGEYQYMVWPSLLGDETYAGDKNLRKRRPPQDWKAMCNLDDVPADCVSNSAVTA